MKLSPFALSTQRRLARVLHRRATMRNQEAQVHRQAAFARLRSSITSPHAMALAAISGLLVGTLSPQGGRGETAGSRCRPITNNLAVRQIIRAVRAVVIRRLVSALGS